MAYDGPERREGMAEVHQKLTDIQIDVGVLKARQEGTDKTLLDLIAKHERLLVGNGQPGLVKDVDRLKTAEAARASTFKVVTAAVVALVLKTLWGVWTVLVK